MRILTIAFVLMGLLSRPVQAQQAPLAIPPSDRQTQLFRGLLNFHEITPVTAAEVNRAGFDFNDLIVIEVGNSIGRYEALTRKTLTRSGAVLIASSQQRDASGAFPSPADIRITGTPVLFDTEAVGIVVPVVPSQTERLAMVLNPIPELELFNGFNRIQVQQSSSISIGKRPKELNRIVANFPGQAFTVPPGALNRRRLKADMSYAVAGAGDDKNPYRCLMMADDLILSNHSLYSSAREGEQTENFLFADRLVQWLQGPRKRSRCIFIENGEVVDRFDEFQFSSIPQDLPEMPNPPIPTIPDPLDPELQRELGDMANRAMDELQKNEPLSRRLKESQERTAGVYLGLAVMAAVLLYAVLRYRVVLGNNFAPLFRPMPKDPHQLGPNVLVGSLHHRQLELLRSSNYGPVVREYALRLFQERGLPAASLAGKLPKVVFQLRRTEYLQESLRAVWKAIQSDKPISFSQWKLLEPMLGALRAAADDDRWSFAGPNEDKHDS